MIFSNTASKILAFLMASALVVPVLISYVSPAHAKAEINEDTTGCVRIEDVKDNEEFIATRVINTTYNGSLSRSFALGFSYGDNFDNRSDNGLSAYLSLTDASALADAVEGFAKQITDQSESYRTVSAGGVAFFDNLPMGQYVIVGVPTDASRSYQMMIGNVEPTVFDGEYQMTPITISAKFEDFITEKPKLTLDKTADKEEIMRGDTISYRVEVSPLRGSSKVRNIHIVDALTPDTIATGMYLNQDVVIFDKDGVPIEDAVITYTNVNKFAIGYTIDLLGEFEPDAKFIVTYTGNTSAMIEDANITNIAQTWCDKVDPIDDTVVVKVNSKLTITQGESAYPDQLKVSVELFQTGDVLPYVFCGAAATALLGIIIAVVVRRRRDR